MQTRRTVFQFLAGLIPAFGIAKAAKPSPAQKLQHPYVTIAEFANFLEFHGHVTHADFAKSLKCDTGDLVAARNPLLPSLGASSKQAEEYCKWAGGRLPTSDELQGQFCPIWEWASDKLTGTDGKILQVTKAVLVSYRINRRGVGTEGAPLRSLVAGADLLARATDTSDNGLLHIGFRCVMEK
jgi:formylglycine-generating enzyme required for sulfatase activity